MRKDPTEFRERFAKWKAGEKVYENGLPAYGGGKSTKKGSYYLPGEKIRRELDVPYDNASYDYRRANQLGYEPDETGHLPSRDWITGRYLKTPTHPTESLAIYTDLGLGYDVFDKYGNTYSQPNWGSTWQSRLPGYRKGKPGWNLRKPKQLEEQEEQQDNTRIVVQQEAKPIKRQYGRVVDPKLVERKQQQQPTVKQGKDYTQRRIEEETRRTWLSDAADIAHGAGEGAMFASNFIPFAGQLFAGGRALLNNARSYLLHPVYKTVYHGSPYPFDIKNAWTATANDLGLHVAENRLTADIMKEGNGVVYKLRIPKENTETIDIGMNGARQLSTNFEMAARPNTRGYFSGSYYDTSAGDNLRIKMIQDAGGEPTVINDRLFIENPVKLNIRDVAYPNLTTQQKDIASQLSRMSWANTDAFTGRYISPKIQKDLNQKAADLLSSANYKVIKYHNANSLEGGGTAYMITDPSVIDIIQTVPKGFYNPFAGAIGGEFSNYAYNKYAE